MEDFTSFEECINSVRWQYSIKYNRSPHEYTIFNWTDKNNQKTLRDIAIFIREKGTPILFWGKPYNNLLLGEYRYWIMEENPYDTTLINRTYRDNSILEEIRKYVNSDRFVHKKGMSLDDIYKEIVNGE